MTEGIPFFPIDCLPDEKFQYIEAEFGIKGYAVIIKLLQRIYGGHGYYCEYNDRVAVMFSHSIGVGVSAVREVVSAAIREGIFDKEMYEKHAILTSADIQRRYMTIAKRRKKVFHTSEFVIPTILSELKNVCKNRENADNSSENADKNEQSKVK